MNALLLVDHGSRREEANASLAQAAALVQQRAPALIVEVAHMELAPPTIAEAFAACVARGATRVHVFPWFLAEGRHVTEDIPRLVAEAAASLAVEYEIAPPFGLHPLLADIALSRAGLLPEDAS